MCGDLLTIRMFFFRKDFPACAQRSEPLALRRPHLLSGRLEGRPPALRATAKSFTEVSAYPSIHGPKDGPLLGMNGFQEMRTVRAE